MKAIDKLAELGERLRRRPGSASEGDTQPALEPVPVSAASGVSAMSGTGRSRAMTGAGVPPAVRSVPVVRGPADEALVEVPAVTDPTEGGFAAVDPCEEADLWERLRIDPNDVEAFPRLAEIVRHHAAVGHEAVGHEEADRQRAADDAVWALAEELAHNARAWYPLTEMGRLSVHDDREAALRRLSTAAERDPSGRALATGIAVLREANLPSDALGLGMAHWRPREHDLEAGRHLVLAAIEARRVGDARRHLVALSMHPDEGRVAELRLELEGLIQQLEAERAAGGPMTDPAGISVTSPLIDLREVRIPSEETEPH